MKKQKHFSTLCKQSEFRAADFRSRESAQEERVHGLPGAQDGQHPRRAQALQEQMLLPRRPERRPLVADQEAPGLNFRANS